MIEPAIEKLCEEVRQTWGCTTAPVDLNRIACEEGIELTPGDYGTQFHGRLEYLLDEHLFILYYPAAFLSAAQVRIRFTIAHELGHFYLPDHRQALLRGISPECNIGFISDKVAEKQADAFAASLLIPGRLLESRIAKHGFMTLQAVQDMAGTLDVSLPCAIIRYVQYATEACGVVVSEAGKVKYYIASDEMAAIGFRYMARQADIPRNSKAWNLLSSGKHLQIEGMNTDSSRWYSSRPQLAELWEDSISLGYSEQVITLLSVET